MSDVIHILYILYEFIDTHQMILFT